MKNIWHYLETNVRIDNRTRPWIRMVLGLLQAIDGILLFVSFGYLDTSFTLDYACWMFGKCLPRKK